MRISKKKTKLKRAKSKPGLTTPKVSGIDLSIADSWASNISL